jgi:anti-sigma B factor antagonist
MQQSVPSPGFLCDVRPDRERVIVAVAGELDVGAAPQVAETIDDLLDVGFKAIVVDLRELSFLDSAGVHALITAENDARQRGSALSVVRGPRHVHRVFELTGTDSLFAFDDGRPIR